MKIVAKLTDGGAYDISLVGAPPNSIIELRWQDTLSGSSIVDVFEIDASGFAAIDHPAFGQQCVPTVRVLNDKNNIELVTFQYTYDDLGTLILVQSNKTDKVLQPVAQQPTSPKLNFK